LFQSAEDEQTDFSPTEIKKHKRIHRRNPSTPAIKKTPSQMYADGVDISSL
jgi:hypothetical protein